MVESTATPRPPPAGRGHAGRADRPRRPRRQREPPPCATRSLVPRPRPAGGPGTGGSRETEEGRRRPWLTRRARRLALARTAAGAVRSLNHATLGRDGLAQPADAYELIGELAALAWPTCPSSWPRSAGGSPPPSPPCSATTTAPTRPARSAAPGCSSPTPELPPPGAASAPSSNSAAVHGSSRPRNKRKKKENLMIDTVLTRFRLARMPLLARPFSKAAPPPRLRRGRRPHRMGGRREDHRDDHGRSGHRQDGRDPRRSPTSALPRRDIHIDDFPPPRGRVLRGPALGDDHVHGTAALAVQAWSVLAESSSRRRRTGPGHRRGAHARP